MMKGHSMTAADVSALLALLWFPWVIKPFYALVCDFVPFFGYRRKSYLIAASLLAVASFIMISATHSLTLVVTGLVLMATAMAISTTLMVALAVEQGKENGKARDYFSGQVFWYYTANIVAAIAGGLLCQNLAPHMALHWAALIAMMPVILMVFLTGIMLKEEKSELAVDKLIDTWRSLKEALTARSLWFAAALWGAFHFNVFTGVPLYFFESRTLEFAQSTIGQLAACNAIGLLIGSIVYLRVVKKLLLKHQLYLAVFLGAVSALAYLGLSTPLVGMAIEVFRGTSTMVGLLTLYGLSADVCPRRMEASVMAIFLCARNVATEAGTWAGGQLFTNVFHNHYVPLVLTGFGLAAGIVLLLPYAVSAIGSCTNAKK